MDLKAIEQRLSAARTRLILDKPFLGALVLRLPMVAAQPEWCKTTATDARKFYYNPEFIEALHPEEIQFMLCHEALHCGLSHFVRRQHRLKARWDVACDYAINPLLLKEGLMPPPGSLLLREFEGMSAEEIYPCIKEEENLKPLDDHIYDQENQDGGGQQGGVGDKPPSSNSPSAGDGGQTKPESDKEQNNGGQGQSNSPEQGSDGLAKRPPPLLQEERDSLAVQWQQRLAGAAQQAMQAGKMGGTMARTVDFMLQPQLPWRMMLARYVSATARDDYSYTRPSTRRGDPAIYPSLRSAQINLAVALDVSGSVGDKELATFLTEINAIKGQMRARITLHACDAKLAKEGPWCFEPWEEIVLPKSFKGGGGTAFKPMFSWWETQDRQPDLLIYFTDGLGKFPEYAPPYQVIWLIKGKKRVPWGQRVQLN
ncbi:MAG: VWA-like domain-containing protein [Gammaproteobacteria bacterium]|nr:VWA-like domain-containing protein [Gammaproteobacteria bacterium]